MDRQEFATLISSLQLAQSHSVNGGPALRVVYPYNDISAVNSEDSLYKQKGRYYAQCFNAIVDKVAKRVNYGGNVEGFYLSTNLDVRKHIIDINECTRNQDGVYIRNQRCYNDHGSKKRTGLTKGATHTMENRKVKLTLITLLSGATLTLQISGASKDATAWTNFIDPDNSPSEYGDGHVWTKDVNSQNKDAVEAVDKMIQTEADYVAGKLDKETALAQFKDAYVDWVVAHLNTNPDFVERRIVGLNCENPMADYASDQEYSDEQ